ncbi:MAG: hypothetical protein WAW02_10630 [Sideroxyarcus sp.]
MDSDLKPTQDEVLRRVGRNLLLFQQIEGLLKFLLSFHKAGGTPVDLKERQQKQIDTISRKMFGHLVEKYGTDVLKDAGVEVPDEEGPADWITFSFRVSGNAEFIEAMRRDMKLMTGQRNELVHGFLPRWQPDSPEKLEETLAYLDNQREKVLLMHEHLRTTASHIQESRNKLLEFMSSEEYQKQSELMWLQASPLVSFLRDVASQVHRKDGWSYLAHAGRLANQELPEDVNNINERYGFKTLKKLIIGSEMFEVFDEPLSEGQFRTLYKNKERH